MALDGIFLNCLKNELNSLIGFRVEKVYQPSKREIILNLRGKDGAHRLLLSAAANSARVHITQHSIENPPSPPMFCMLLRKYLTGAVLKGIRQYELDRILFFDFDASNEIGDRSSLCLCVEIMAQHSNIILTGKGGKIIDSLVRVDITKSSVRQIQPGLYYQLPPSQNKINILTADKYEITEYISSHRTSKLSQALLKSVMGISPLICREIAHNCLGDDRDVRDLGSNDLACVENRLLELTDSIKNKVYRPTIIYNENSPLDFSFDKIRQYGSSVVNQSTDTFSELLDIFYYEKDKLERIAKRSQDLRKNLNNIYERISKKLQNQLIELETCKDRDELRIYAELISANQYSLKKGSLYFDLANYYDDNKYIRIKADPALTPMQNSQKYYKEYRKACTAEKKLKELIDDAAQELKYLDSVFDALSRASSDMEISEIREELFSQGYIRSQRKNKSNKKEPKALSPLAFKSSDGFFIYAGRNNIQNDKLTLKTAAKSDVWLHVQNFPGAHVIISLDGREISETALLQGAMIAAYFSKARESSQVPVDYTHVRYLKKPGGARPGTVVYTVYNTIYVSPDPELIKDLAVE